MTDTIILADYVYYEDAFQDKESPFHRLFKYALALQGKLADEFCTCEYISPGKNANTPEVHKEECPFRIAIEELKNE